MWKSKGCAQNDARENGNAAPTWMEQAGSVFVTFKPSPLIETPEVAPEVTPEVRLLKALTTDMSRQELQAALGMKDNEHFRKAYLLPMLERGLIEMTIPDKPRSSKQKYRLTDAGRKVLEPRNTRTTRK